MAVSQAGNVAEVSLAEAAHPYCRALRVAMASV